MPIKLIGTIILLVLVTIFAGFNIENKCNINLIFRQFENVPIFFSLMCAFVAGVVVTLPFTIGKGGKISKKTKDEKKAELAEKKTNKLFEDEMKKAQKAEAKAKKKLGEKVSGTEKKSDNNSNVDSVIPV